MIAKSYVRQKEQPHFVSNIALRLCDVLTQQHVPNNLFLMTNSKSLTSRNMLRHITSVRTMLQRLKDTQEIVFLCDTDGGMTTPFHALQSDCQTVLSFQYQQILTVY